MDSRFLGNDVLLDLTQMQYDKMDMRRLIEKIQVEALMSPNFPG
jgi:SepF-like predicted cell division protein (DUF552 family)